MKLAIVGTGIAGMGCAHFLHRQFDLTLYEQNDYAGGHTNTVTVAEAGRAVSMDTGFMVYNEVTYPNLTRLFKELGVQTQPTSMSFGVQVRELGLEYCGSSYARLFAQKRNLFNLRFLRMLMTIARFNSEAVAALNDPRYESYSLGRFAEEKNYGRDFLEQYLIPMASAVWSTPPREMMDFPATSLIRFFHNHGFLGMHTQHPWRTVTGGSRSYAVKLTAPFRDRIRLKQKVTRVTRENGKAVVETAAGKEIYDKVIFASHGDQTLRMLGDPTETERRILGAFRYQPNLATVHTDASVMPKAKGAWASWNVRIERGPGGEPRYSTHYWMNSLQGVSDRTDYFVSINEGGKVDPKKILRTIDYEHPLYDLAATRAQKELPSLNAAGPGQTTYFCGSYFKYGFHEDAFTSAVDLCRVIRGGDPWNN
jgi:predicted NAD/FAD-binding protein